MSSRNRSAAKSRFLNKLCGRKHKAGRNSETRSHRGGRNLQIEGLESREMFAVSSIYLSGGAIQVFTDNNPTSVTVSPVGSNYRVSEVGTTRTWDYAASSVGRLDFIGGAGNDRFVNNVANLATRAWGQGGNDYLEGYNAVDEFYGGEGNDTLLGYGGNDILRGGNGNDVIKGMAGADYLVGEGGNDYVDGGSENDQIWGGDGDDTLLGGLGDDQIVGDNGNDHLNGQGGFDRLWGVEGNDVLVSIDGTFGEYVDGGNGNDVLWIDGINTLFVKASDSTPGLSSSDVVQSVGAFSNGADLTLDGDNLADPSDIGAKVRFTNNITADNIRGSNPLFAGPGIGMTSSGVFYPTPGGPKGTDTDQNALGDCFLIGSLNAIANQSPELITRNVVDFNDGTYGVRLADSFYRVDNELAVKSTADGAVNSNLRFAGLGAQNSLWVAVVEKAFAAYHSSANTFAKLDEGGFEKDVFRAFRMRDIGSYKISSIYGSATYMANDFYNRWLNGFAQTISIDTSDKGGHVFTVSGFTRNAAGTIVGIVLRNPWARDGLSSFSVFAGADGGSDANDGFFTVSISTLFNSGGWTDWAHA